uniref:Putative secreted protein n=1 Tax=Anopheles marajoara TaxID=58244 RepID=A0A2M4CD72_9DIPT
MLLLLMMLLLLLLLMSFVSDRTPAGFRQLPRSGMRQMLARIVGARHYQRLGGLVVWRARRWRLFHFYTAYGFC